MALSIGGQFACVSSFAVVQLKIVENELRKVPNGGWSMTTRIFTSIFRIKLRSSYNKKGLDD